MDRIVYVILHYNDEIVTIKCVESLLHIIGSDSEIVIVDNASPNNSGELLQKKYKMFEHINVILNNDNAGFAKGNNVGYIYARDTLHADVIVDMNNDVEIHQEDFEETIHYFIENNSSVGVIAPRVINALGNEQNPFRKNRISSTTRIRNLVSSILYYLGLKSIAWKTTIRVIERKSDESVKKKIETETIYGVVPHGSCVVFCPSYVSVSSYAFEPITFFYCEEDILFDRMQILGLDTCYVPNLCVMHKEKVATNSINTSHRDKLTFQMKCRIQSIAASLKYRIQNHILWEK